MVETIARPPAPPQSSIKNDLLQKKYLQMRPDAKKLLRPWMRENSLIGCRRSYFLTFSFRSDSMVEAFSIIIIMSAIKKMEINKRLKANNYQPKSTFA